jgi:hypothetical protein
MEATLASKNTPSVAQTWRTEKGTFYAVNRSRKLAFRRTDGGPWANDTLRSKEALANEEVVGSDKIDDGWFTVYRLRA